MSQVQPTGDGSEERIQRIEREFDALRTDVKRQKTPWYTKAAVLISLLAFGLSLGTAYLSNERLKAQDVQNRKVELRGLLQRLSALPREYVNAVGTDNKDQALIATISSSVGQESTMLSRQALELAKKLPREDVAASEWFTIGVALRGDLKYEEAKEVFGYAFESSGGLIEKVAVMRATADVLYAMDRVPAGRGEYERALDIFSQVKEFKDYGDRIKNETHIQTYLSCAYSEASLGIENNKKVNERLDEAEVLALKLPAGRRTDDIKSMIAEARKELNSKNEPAAPPVVKRGAKEDAAGSTTSAPVPPIGTTLVPVPPVEPGRRPTTRRGGNARRTPPFPFPAPPQQRRINTRARRGGNRNSIGQPPPRRRRRW